MIRKIMIICTVFFLGVLQTGCGRKQDTVYLENAVQETEKAEDSAIEQLADSQNGQTIEQLADSQSGQTIQQGQASSEEAPQEEICYVYVCGAVANPGVYQLSAGSRIYEAIALAGGLLETAGVDAVNQAETIADGQMIRVPTKEEVLAGMTEGDSLQEGADGQTPDVSDGRLDVNTASVADFMTLPGIGQAKADAIIDYRTEHGGFSTIEEIMNVEGIKEGVFNRIKDDIKVK